MRAGLQKLLKAASGTTACTRACMGSVWVLHGEKAEGAGSRK